MENEALNKQAEKLRKEEIILKHYLEGVPTNQIQDMLGLLEYERALIMMQYTSRIKIIKDVLKSRGADA